jgi:hypothetical protein
MEYKDGEKGHIWRFRVAFIVVIMLFSVLFLSLNANALLTDGLLFGINENASVNIINGKGADSMSVSGINTSVNNGWINKGFGTFSSTSKYIVNASLTDGMNTLSKGVTGVTIAVALNVTGGAGGYNRVIKLRESAGSQLGYGLQFRNDDADSLVAWEQNSAGECFSYNASAINDTTGGLNKWYLVVAVFNLSGSYLYSNGILIGHNTLDSGGGCTYNYTTAMGELNIGKDGSEFFTGDLDEVYIWNRTLNQSEITDFNNAMVNKQTYPFGSYGFFSIKAKDLFNQSININSFSADINGTLYNTTTGTIITNINMSLSEIYNITIMSSENGGYFNKNYINYTTSTNLTTYMYQAEANMTMIAKILNYTIPVNTATNFTIITSNPVQSINDYTKKLYLRTNTNVTIRASAGWGYYVYGYYNLTPFFNGTLNIVNVYNQSLIVQLRDGNNNSVIQSYNVTIYNDNYNYTETLTTSNGNVTIPTLRNFTLNLTFIPTNANYSILYTNITTIDNTSNFKIFTNFPSNSINISIYNETSTTYITERINIELVSDTLIINTNTSNGKLFISNIPEGFYSISFSAPSGNYSERIYYVTIGNRTTQILNAYLPFINNSVPISIYLKTIDNNILEGGLITIQKQFNTTWLTIAQKYTDVTGLAVFNLINANTYKFIISASGYTTREFELQVYYINSPYNIKLEPSGYTPYTNAYQYVQYYYNPSDSIVNPASPVNFSITTFSNESKLEYTYINVNGSILNLSGSPSGVTASINYNLTNYQGVLQVIYGFKVQGFNPIFWTINYYVNQNQGYNGTDIYTTLTAVKTEVNNQGWTSLIAIFVAVVVAITITQLSGNPTISTIGAFFVLIFFLLIGWLPLTAVAFASVIGLLMLYLQRGGY